MKKKISILLFMTLLLILVGCGGGEGGGKDYVGTWEASVRKGYSTQTVTYNITHASGNEYLIAVEIDGQKQDRTIQAVYKNDTFILSSLGDHAVLDGKNRMILSGMDFKRVK